MISRLHNYTYACLREKVSGYVSDMGLFGPLVTVLIGFENLILPRVKIISWN